MMVRILAALLLCVISASAWAQPAPSSDPAFLEKALQAMQVQRNQALDTQAVWQARAGVLADENGKLKAQVAELGKQIEDAKKKGEPQK